MMDDSDPLARAYRMPTPSRPLLGLTILVVEDSRYACEAMRLLCLRSGARIRRADCLKSARRHLQVYRPTVVIVDVGLPDGSGLDLIAQLNLAAPRVSAIIGISGDESSAQKAMDAGADGFIAKPITSLSTFQNAVLELLPADRRPTGLRVVTDEEVSPDPIAFQDDMAHVADVMSDQSDGSVLDYVAQFLSGVARSAHDDVLAKAADDLAQARKSGGQVATNAARVAGLVQERLQQKRAI